MKPFKFFPILLQIPIYWTTFLLFKTFCRFSVRGFENVRALPPGIIFASNHASEWDGILIRVALPFFSKKFSPMYYVARTKEFYTNSGWRQLIYGGFFFKLLGAYPVYSGRKDYTHSLKHYLEILKLKRNICIFPEGVRTRDGKIGEPHGGVAFLAHATGAPIAPTAVTNMFRLTFRDFLFRRRRVEVVFGKPLWPKDMFPEGSLTVSAVSDFKIAAQRVMREVVSLLG